MNILSTWKNAAYCQSLITEAQTVNSIGEVELTDADLGAIHGGSGSGILNDNLNGNNINVLGGPNTILNNVGILGTGSSNYSNHGSGHGSGGYNRGSGYSNHGSDNGYGCQC
ncbi:MAG TPA: hypothetical protein VGL94_23195 [Ktedonobacteraceae bacterium]|jgi:hypothetical protein